MKSFEVYFRLQNQADFVTVHVSRILAPTEANNTWVSRKIVSQKIVLVYLFCHGCHSLLVRLRLQRSMYELRRRERIGLKNAPFQNKTCMLTFLTVSSGFNSDAKRVWHCRSCLGHQWHKPNNTTWVLTRDVIRLPLLSCRNAALL